MAIINKFTLLKILMVLAEVSPHYLLVGEIAKKINKSINQIYDVHRHLVYLRDKEYVVLDKRVLKYRISAKGIDYLEQYKRELGEKLERKQLRFCLEFLAEKNWKGKIRILSLKTLVSC